MSQIGNTTLAPCIPVLGEPGTNATVKLEKSKVYGNTPATGEKSATEHKDEKLAKACQDFEAIFLRFILKKLRDSVPKDGLIETSDAQQTYQEMLDGALADDISKAGTVGLAQMLMKQMSSQGHSAADVQAAASSVDIQGKGLQAIQAYSKRSNISFTTK